MIQCNGKTVSVNHFPDGTTLFDKSIDGIFDRVITRIKWLFERNEEMVTLWYLVHYLRDRGCDHISLYMPYIPNARMDRVKTESDVFTLKYFAEIINILHFNEVYVCDPHSSVSTALLDRVKVIDAKGNIEEVLRILDSNQKKDILLCYPDEGAAKRYSEQLNAEYVFCIKHRDWRTGKIQRLELTSSETVKGRNVLIVDDICSRGGTFTFAAQALKDAGAKEVFLYVTHCENTIEKGSVLTDGLISRVFTTSSIYRGKHTNVTVMR